MVVYCSLGSSSADFSTLSQLYQDICERIGTRIMVNSTRNPFMGSVVPVPVYAGQVESCPGEVLHRTTRPADSSDRHERLACRMGINLRPESMYNRRRAMLLTSLPNT